MDKAKTLVLSMVIIFMATLLYADKALEPIPIVSYSEGENFSEWVNITNRGREDDSDLLRAEWKQALGVDIFYVHFKAEEITHKIEEKTKFRLFNMRGKAKIKTDSAVYTFSHKF